MTCPTCAAQIPDNANFCPSCGRLVRQAPAATGARLPAWVIVLIVAGAMFVLGIPFLAIVAAILIPNFIHARDESRMAADQANLKQIATALEEYAVDHGGRYPDRLVQLLPTYLKSLPDIPGSERAHPYVYHHPATVPVKTTNGSVRPGLQAGAYDIWDNGSMDQTTFAKLRRADGLCAYGCKYVVYVEGAGIVGVAGSLVPHERRMRTETKSNSGVKARNDK